jgi:RNA polymerase sigma-70 factor (ECF subfamily)
MLIFLLIQDDSDRQFMEGLYTQYRRLMYAQALQVLRSHEAAEDAVSESLIQLIKKISLLRTLECNKLKAYVVITVKHTAITLLHRREREQPADEMVFQHVAADSRADDAVLEAAGVERIKNAILALPTWEKDMMLMRYFRDMSDEEIAAATGLKAVSVRVHLSRARKRLAEMLGGKGEEI